MSWNITGQEFQGFGMKLKVFALTFRDLAQHVCQKNIRMASGYLSNIQDFWNLNMWGSKSKTYGRLILKTEFVHSTCFN